MNLDLLYLATDLTNDPKYAEIATKQAWKSINTLVRPDYTTYHGVDFDRKGGYNTRLTFQGKISSRSIDGAEMQATGTILPGLVVKRGGCMDTRNAVSGFHRSGNVG